MANEAAQTLALNAGIRSLLADLDRHLPGEHGHAERVSVFATATGHELGLRDTDLLELRMAAQLHDIGKLTLDADLFLRDDLEEVEQALRRSHSELGASLLLRELGMKNAAKGVLHHHEHWNGTGYPGGLRGNEIPLVSRIIAVAESFDAMAYAYFNSQKVSDQEAAERIWDLAGTTFDPSVVEALLKVQPLIQPVT